MRNKNLLLPVKGLRTPRIFLWFRGLVHGKIIHTGGLDPGTGKMSSGFITGQTNRFRTECVTCVDQAIERLKPVWDTAGSLLIEYKRLSSEVKTLEAIRTSHGDKGPEARVREQSAARYEKLTADRTDILKKMEIIINQILTEADTVENRIQATGEALLSTFAAYGHGLLLKPVVCSYLPDLAFDAFREKILGEHMDDFNKINRILKEEK